MVETCESCRFAHILWRKGDKYMQGSYSMAPYEAERPATYLECRRYAPRGPLVIPESLQEVSTFPTCLGDHWCGEHQPKGASNG